jgi:predicted unusual protein kinase regulating ubiquinone biosynthesis (AarF/ABC1/UbiB family)
MTATVSTPPRLGAFGRSEVARGVSAAGRVGTELLRAAPTAIRTRAVAKPAADALVDAFEELGPTFVKLGQLIASSPGLFPAPLATACRRTLDRVPPATTAEITAVITADLGAPPSRLFGQFDPRPLSAASIAQVHAVRLLDGREAVVKVQRPDLRRRVNTDLRILYQLARAADRSKHLHMANPVAVIEGLHKVTNEELDFGLEADRQARFRAALHTFGDNDDVTAPEIHPELCGSRVVCMERVHGTPVDRFSGDPERGEHLLRAAVKAWLEAVCLHGPFHGDLHAGNLWILDDDRIAFLDFGIMGDLGDDWRLAFRNLLVTIMIDGDYHRMVRDFIRLGVLQASPGSEATMAGALESIIGPMADSTITSVALGDLLQLVLASLTQFGAIAPPELMLVAKQVLYVERYMARLAPDWQLARDTTLLTNVHPPAAPEESRHA